MDIDRIISSQQISRRNLLKRGGLLAGAAIGMPAILAACAPDAPTPPAASTEPTAIDTSNIAGSKIKVGTYGGFFEENFARCTRPSPRSPMSRLNPSRSRPRRYGSCCLSRPSRPAGPPPADVSMLSGVGLQRAINGDILAKYATSDIPTSKNLEDGYVRTDDDGNVTGVGGLSWYITLVSNTDRVKDSPGHVVGLLGPAVEERAGVAPERCQLLLARDHRRDTTSAATTSSRPRRACSR